MSDGGFHHDGEGHGSCTGYGCNCDEKRYGHHSSGGGGGNDGCIIWVLFIIALAIGAWNELVGAVLLIFLFFFVVFLR